MHFAGKGGRFPKGTKDPAIVEASASEGRYMVTRNLDMVILWAGAGGKFIWFDPRNEPTRFQQAKMVFNNWDRWERALGDGVTECLRVGLTTCHPLRFDDAVQQVEERYERQQAALERRRVRDQERHAAASLTSRATPEQGSLLDLTEPDD